jgi:rod shape-determining protein MreD
MKAIINLLGRRTMQLWQLLLASLGLLFAPLLFVLAPFKRFWPRHLFNKRASAWRSAPMAVSEQNLSSGIFKANELGRAAPQTILRPVSPLFVFVSLLIALCMNLLPWGSWHWVPDWLALALLFWVSREPRLVGFGVAFIFGLLMDVHDGTVMGEHALSYCLLCYAALALSRRLPSFDMGSQSLQIWPVLLAAQAVTLIVRVFFGGHFPGWTAALVAPTLGAIIWPVVTWVLLIPQRKPLDIDKNRPL